MILSILFALISCILFAIIIGIGTRPLPEPIDSLQEDAVADPVVYEDEQIGSVTVYPDNAILELLDGTVYVFPKMLDGAELVE